MNREAALDLHVTMGSTGRNRLRRPTCEGESQGKSLAAILYLRTGQSAETVLEFCTFDADYIERLRAGDLETEKHFVGYFTELLQLKLRSRLKTPQAVEDVSQETFFRVLKAIRNPNGLRQPDRLGAFVNTVCNNVLLEHWRAGNRSDSLDEEGQPEPHATGASALDSAVTQQTQGMVRETLLGLPIRERLLLKAVFLDERDREEVCLEFGVDREYLRVLLHRAKQGFKAEYVKRINPITLLPRRNDRETLSRSRTL